MPFISHRISSINESQTVSLTGIVAEMAEQGKDIISLGAGEPDFDTPDFIKNAGINAIKKGFTKYTPVDGIVELKKAIIDWIKREYNVLYVPEEIVITCGAKHAVYQTILTVCDPGDEVILPKPYWVSYPEQIKLAGAKVRYVETSNDTGFKITAHQLEQNMTKNTRLLILNSPNNPSGSVYSAEELEKIVAIIKRSNLYIMSDEIYDQIVYDDINYKSLIEFPEIKDQLIYINGVSKCFAMTGWRLGFLAAHRELAKAVKKYQGHSTSNPSSIAQQAATAGYSADKKFIKEMKNEYEQRRNYVYQRLNSINKVTCVRPQGAFYAFPKVSELYYRERGILTSFDFCKYMLINYNIAIVPGGAFGMDNHVRISFATSMENLEKALDRLNSGVESILL